LTTAPPEAFSSRASMKGNGNKKYDELQTDAEDALVLGLMKRT
jgi:hypothetical protein